MCDVQVITGIGVLISGYLSLSCGLSTYHWKMVVSLAWFSSVTHLSGLNILRNHLRAHACKRNIRFGLMFILLVCLTIALIPTGFFGWEETGPMMVFMSDPALCYFNTGLAEHIRRTRSCGNPSDKGCQSDPIEFTAAFQTMVISVALLAFGFFTRSAKVFKPLSKFVSCNLRRPLSHMLQNNLARLASLIESIEQQAEQKPYALYKADALRIFFFWPLLSIFIAFRLMVDSCSSMLAEVSESIHH